MIMKEERGKKGGERIDRKGREGSERGGRTKMKRDLPVRS
jgi:hypothetical protein